MSKRKHLAKRARDGRVYTYVPKDTELLSPTAARRLLDAAATGLRDQYWGSAAGQLHIKGKLTAVEFATAKRWMAIVTDYSNACRSPPPPKTISFDMPGGGPLDPDSEKGERERLRHEHATALFLEGRNALRIAGLEAERVMDSVCVQDKALAGFGEYTALRVGLAALSALWSDRRKTKGR